MTRMFKRSITLTVSLLLSGCATLFSSGPESIQVRSDPPGARFKYGTFSGTAPATVMVPRNKLAEHASFTMEGYNEKQVPVATEIQGITWLGILFWPSLLIDFANHNAYKLASPVISATLEPANTVAIKVEKMPHVASAPEPRPAQSVEESKKEVAKTTSTVGSRDAEQFKFGVVKVIAKDPQGAQKAGTGFIIRLDKETAYIVTAAHVITGDSQPEIEFFTKRHVAVRASVLGLEGDDELRGLALLVVRGQENLPPGLAALPLASTVPLGGGQDIIVIGFPRAAGPWAVIKGTIVSRQGRTLDIAAALDEGNSGGPMIQDSKVVGMVAGLSQSFGRGLTAASLADYLVGFGITAQ